MKLGNTLLLGDSYSTFEGYIPDGYDSWFSKETQGRTDVSKVEQTWWYQVFDGKENVLLKNESFSGTTICNTVRPELTVDTSFISRFDKLVCSGFFEKNTLDTILIFGSTNDCWINVPFGEIKYEDFTNEDLLSFCPACCYLASRINETVPNAKVFWLINTDLNEEFPKSIKKIANHYNQNCLEFKKIDKMSGHPSVAGMKQIAEALLNY